MRKTFTLVLLTLLGMSSIGLSQDTTRQANTNVSPQPVRRLVLPCCECLGRETKLDLSTGQGSGPVDPYWRVNAGNAFVTPPVSSWVTMPPAKWLQPVASPLPSANVPPGSYSYTVVFTIPRCTIPFSDVSLNGGFSADNSAVATLGGPNIGSCPGPTCFSAVKPLSASGLTTGSHTLTVKVNNISGPSGLIVNASLLGRCRREPTLGN